MIVVPDYSCQTKDDCLLVAGQLAYCYKDKCICLRGALIKDGQCTELLTCLKVCYLHVCMYHSLTDREVASGKLFHSIICWL